MKIVIRDNIDAGVLIIELQNEKSKISVYVKEFSYPCKLSNGDIYEPIGGYRTKFNAMENAVEYKERLETELANNFRIEDLKNEA